MPLFLTALGFDGLGAWLDARGAGARVPVITNASRALEDRRAILAMALDALTAAGREPEALDVLADDLTPLAEADAVLLPGGDPFGLLADLRTSGADRLLTAAHGRGAALVGQSAGAIVLGPDLAPITLTSPFAPPPALDLSGLGLTDHVVLPHHGRPGRNAAHRRAAQRHAPARRLTALWDDEALLTDGAGWSLEAQGVRTRIATENDAAAVAGVFHAAARAAWQHFVPVDSLAAADLDVAAWAARIADAGDEFLVAEDPAGVVAFSRTRGTDDPTTGELDLLYTHPRASGRGLGRRLLERATWQMLCRGYTSAWLWTEARNERALKLYRAAGWVADGAEDVRTYLGAPIHNLRHRLDLTTWAGGA